MIYLFIHQNFPGQYLNLVRHFARDPNNTVYFISQPNQNWIDGVIKLVYYPDPGAVTNCHAYTTEFDSAMRHGSGVARCLTLLKQQGVRPDLILGHSGWGETLFVKDVYPDVPVMAYFEYYYQAEGADADFDPEFQAIPANPFQLRARNATNVMSWVGADWGNTPTNWQHSLYPAELRKKISIIHEGIDTDLVCPDPAAWLAVGPDKRILRAGDEIITYVSRNLEPYRGFHTFMRALPQILRQRPNAHVVIVGGDAVSYGVALPDGRTYRQKMIEEVGSGIDFRRVHFMGQIDYTSYLRLLQISSAHVYLTYPFVLSWSFLEAMAAGCALIASDTAPVLELAEDERNALLVDFHSPDEVAERILEVLDDRQLARSLGEAARRDICESFDLTTRILPQWVALTNSKIKLAA